MNGLLSQAAFQTLPIRHVHSSFMWKAAKALAAGAMKETAGVNHGKEEACWTQSPLEKRLLEKSIGSVRGVNFSQSFLLREVFFWERFSFLLRIQISLVSCSVLSLQQNTASTFHFLSCLVGCWGDVISELVCVSAGPYSQQNLWHMPVPPLADWIRPGKWRKPQLAELQKMNFT